MELAKLIENTRTCHRYEPRSVDPVLIERALSLSLHAPNHKFTFPWHYYWIGRSAKEKIFDLALSNLKKKDPEVADEDVELLKEKLLYPEMLFFAKNKCDKEVTSIEDYATLSCSIQLFALALAEHNIAYKWSTGSLAFEPKCHQIFGLEASHEVVGMILCGYRKTGPGPFVRPELEKVLHRIS